MCTIFELGVALSQFTTPELPPQIQYSCLRSTYLISVIFFPNSLTQETRREDGTLLCLKKERSPTSLFDGITLVSELDGRGTRT